MQRARAIALAAVVSTLGCDGDDYDDSTFLAEIRDSRGNRVPRAMVTHFETDGTTEGAVFSCEPVPLGEDVEPCDTFYRNRGDLRFVVEAPGFLPFDGFAEADDGISERIVLVDDPSPTALCQSSCAVQTSCTSDFASEAECVELCLDGLSLTEESAPCRPTYAALEDCVSRLTCEGLEVFHESEQNDCALYERLVTQCEEAHGDGTP